MSEHPDNLKHLVKQYIVANRLNQYKTLTELSAKISSKLIEFLDFELENSSQIGKQHEFYGLSESELIRFIEDICDLIRRNAFLASTYGDVVEFVWEQDEICLSKLVGAIDDKGQEATNKLDDFNDLRNILRKSIFLLKSFNDQNSYDLLKSQGFWVDKGSIERLEGIGFPVYRIQLNLNNNHNEYGEETTMNSIRNRLNFMIDKKEQSGEKVSDNTLLGFLLTDWFCNHFLQERLLRPLPLDRFTILISIWIIAEHCKELTCQQLLSELVDQIYHQEINTNNKEELMQLTQAGSFWLSYYKKFQANLIKRGQDELIEEADEEESDYEDHSANTTTNNQVDDLDDKAFQQTTTMGKQALELNRRELRRIIEEKLLYGSECFACGYIPPRSSDLLEPLRSKFCSNCNTNLNAQQLITSEFFDEVPMVDLKFLQSPRMADCYLITLNEWARQMIDLSRVKPRQARGSVQPHRKVQTDTSERFDRLTVTQPTEDEQEPSDDDHQESDTSSSGSLGDESKHENGYLPLLKRFMDGRQDFAFRRTLESSRKQLDGATMSESLSLLRSLVKEKNYQARISAAHRYDNLPLCSTDFLVLEETVGESVLLKVSLLARADWLSCGTLWTCRARSQTSGLLMGCCRLFNSMELMKLGQSNKCVQAIEDSGIFLCPKCGQQLIKLISLFERLRDD